MYKRVKCIKDVEIGQFILPKGSFYTLDLETQRLKVTYFLEIQLTKLQMNNFKEI